MGFNNMLLSVGLIGLGVSVTRYIRGKNGHKEYNKK